MTYLFNVGAFKDVGSTGHAWMQGPTILCFGEGCVAGSGRLEVGPQNWWEVHGGRIGGMWEGALKNGGRWEAGLVGNARGALKNCGRREICPTYSGRWEVGPQTRWEIGG